MNALPLLLALVYADPSASPHTQPTDHPAPTFGIDLSADAAVTGWLALFDGETDTGWHEAMVRGGTLSRGRTTVKWWGRLQVRCNVAQPGKLHCGRQDLSLPAGRSEQSWNLEGVAPLQLGDGLVVRSLGIRPQVAELKDARWRILGHPRLPKEQQTRWTIRDGVVRGVGGPGCVELERREFGDFIMQATVTAHGKLTNGGIFFRAIAGDFMNGYEAQVFNGCLEGDSRRPSKWSTGALDDRQNARRLVSRDDVPFYYTIVAQGPHIATWINGYQQIAWTDERPAHDNPRKGRRTRPGVLQLQAHDAGTDVEFANIRLMELPAK